MTAIINNNPFLSFDFFASIKERIKEAVETLLPNSDHKLNNSEVQITREFENQSAVDVTVIDRNNMVFDYQSSNPRYKHDGKFIIRDTYSFIDQPSLKRFYQNMVKRQNEKGHHGKLTEWIVGQISDKIGPYSDFRNAPYKFAIQYVIELKELEKHDWIYLSNTDIMLARSEKANGVLHLGSDLAARENAVKHFFQERLNDGISHAVVYDVIDDEHKVNSVFCNLSVDGKEVTEIKPKRVFSVGRKRGVFRSVVKREESGELHVRTEHVALDESAKIGLYTSREDALTKGNPALLREKEIAEANIRTAEANAKIAEMKNETAIKNERLVQLEQQYKEKNTAAANQREELNTQQALIKTLQEQIKGLQDIEHAKKKQELEIQKSERDNKSEKRSHKRKDKSEKLKFGVSMAASIASLVLGLFTIFKRA